MECQKNPHMKKQELHIANVLKIALHIANDHEIPYKRNDREQFFLVCNVSNNNDSCS